MMDIVFFKNSDKNIISVNPIDAKTPLELRKKINASKEKLILVIGNNESVIGEAVANKRVDILLDPTSGGYKDAMHYRHAGLNIEFCRSAHKNEVAIGFSFEKLFEKSNRAQHIGRTIQNVKMCRKYKLDVVLANFSFFEKRIRDVQTIKAFGNIIGLRTDEVNNALLTAEKILRLKDKRISKAVTKP
jgi:RNase P/RNase MRP subunit p30